MTIRASSRPVRSTSLARVGVLAVAATTTVLGLSVLPVSGAGADTSTTTTTATPTTTSGAPTTTTVAPSSTSSTTTAPTTTPPSSTTPTTSAPAAAPSTAPSANAALTVPSYWTVASDGGIFSFGGAPFYGSEGGKPLAAPIVGMASTPDHGGYWLVASDGGIFAFGDANFYGSQGGAPLNQPIVGMAATADGGGYWMVASDGGIFAFGDAAFAGSMGGTRLNAPVVGMAATPGGGYLLVGSDGGIFGFGSGNSHFYGSEGGLRLNAPVVGMTMTNTGNGYWLVASDGGIFSFGDAGYYGSMGGQHLNAPMVGIGQSLGNGTFTKPVPTTILTSGSSGYDVSIFNCGNLPGAGSVNVVQVTGRSSGATNGCLSQEANWAGAGLNLYIFLTFGATSSANMPAYCNGNVYYCYGWQAGLYALGQAQAAGVPVGVNWWLDVESTSGSGLPAWSSNTLQNDWVIQGAHDGLAANGAANVGVYASPGGGWPQIAGNWPIDYPYWMATWTSSGVNSCGTRAGWQKSTPGLPTGGIPMVQWTDDAQTVNGQAVDGDYVC